MKGKPKVIIAMSGGVDSTIAAYSLIHEGYEVVGVYLDLWKGFSDDENTLRSEIETREKLDKLSGELAIPIHVLDRKQLFYQKIVTYFLSSLKDGLTPNPCVVCNKHMKFQALFETLVEMDADYIATGHYARTRQKKDGKSLLLKGLDRTKDQSYYLALLDQETLRRTFFPLGNIHKGDVKKLYKNEIDPLTDITESQDLCFLSGRDYRTFLQKYAPESRQPGDILDCSGEIIGRHEGLAFYTIGQRKGLQIAGNEPYYVIQKNSDTNVLLVGLLQDLGRDHFQVKHINWVSGECDDKEKQYDVKIRYRAKPVRASTKYNPEMGEFEIKTRKKLRDITPGQFAVLYHGESVIAAGEISL